MLFAGTAWQRVVHRGRLAHQPSLAYTLSLNQEINPQWVCSVNQSVCVHLLMSENVIPRVLCRYPDCKDMSLKYTLHYLCVFVCVLCQHAQCLCSLAAGSVAVARQSGVAAYVPGVSSLFSPAGRPTYCQPRNRRAGQGP